MRTRPAGVVSSVREYDPVTGQLVRVLVPERSVGFHLPRGLRRRSRVLVNRIAGAGQHHLGNAKPHSRVVHVMSHRLAASLDVLHAMLQVPLYVQRIAHPILLVSRGKCARVRLSALLVGEVGLSDPRTYRTLSRAALARAVW